jgi:sulfate adenylyltransferase subunit 2
VWDTHKAFIHLQHIGATGTKRTAERKLQELGLAPAALNPEDLRDENNQAPTRVVLNWDIDQARLRRDLVLFIQLIQLPDGQDCLYANDGRGARYWVPKPSSPREGLIALQAHLGKPIALFPHGRITALLRVAPPMPDVRIELLSYPPILPASSTATPAPRHHRAAADGHLTHLDRLEAESIFIMREVVAQADRPVMLYSIGKDSSVMLHLARKAFFPAPPPFPLLHVDTRWKFREMYLLRDRMARESGMELLVHVNPEAIEKNINPIDHGSALHTDITKTEGLKQALDKGQFDFAFGGARRDEEKSRAKERVFSFRSAAHGWDPKNQRPELWNLYNCRKHKGESIRVFPLSNWTELDVWHYIYRENIPIVPLYFAKERPVVVRDGMILMIDDDRMPIGANETIERRMVRFRTLGCYPLSGAIDSTATTLPEILLELLNARTSERQGRAIDSDSSGSMERKKQEGYF